MAGIKVVRTPTIQDARIDERVHETSTFLPNLETNIIGGGSGSSSGSSSGGSSPYISPIITLSGTTPTINCANGRNRIFEITLTGNTTYSIINATVGQIFIVRVKQGSGTTYTNTWFSTVTWVATGGTAPVQTTTSNGITTYGFVCRAANTYDGYLLGSS